MSSNRRWPNTNWNRVIGSEEEIWARTYIRGEEIKLEKKKFGEEEDWTFIVLTKKKFHFILTKVKKIDSKK